MTFEEQMRGFSQRIKNIKDNITTEEATKTSLIMPFFQALGYDIFNPAEFIPEFTADVGIKKGEKVDYAIMLGGEPAILIECKSVNENLTKHDSQLFRYFGTTKAKFAILTNGVIYRFFTDLDEQNKMDEKPFLEINMLALKEAHIQELKKFSKEVFDLESIMDTASDLKDLGLIRLVISDIFNAEPSDDFTRYVLSCGVYDGVKTQNVIDRFKALIKKSISTYINDLVNDRIQGALDSQKASESVSVSVSVETAKEEEKEEEPRIITTDEELEAYHIVRAILSEDVPLERIAYKDTLNYFGVLLDSKTTRWICRIVLKEKTQYLIIPNEAKEEKRYDLESLSDIFKYKEPLKERLMCLLIEYDK